MRKYFKVSLITFIIVAISIVLYFFYSNNNSTKGEPKRARFVDADYNQSIEVIYYRKG
ncbi:putative membrane protein YukC [Brassicibacter mesophilus]